MLNYIFIFQAFTYVAVDWGKVVKVISYSRAVFGQMVPDDSPLGEGCHTMHNIKLRQIILNTSTCNTV